MSVDAQQLIFSSEWPIQRVLLHNEKAVTAPRFDGGLVQVEDLTSMGLIKPPKFFMSFSIDGGTTWLQGGENMYNGNGNGPVMAATATSLSIVGPGTGTAFGATIKYWVFSTYSKAN